MLSLLIGHISVMKSLLFYPEKIVATVSTVSSMVDHAILSNGIEYTL